MAARFAGTVLFAFLAVAMYGQAETTIITESSDPI